MHEFSNTLAGFLERLEREGIDERKECGGLSFLERQVMQQLVSRERVLRVLEKEAA